MYKKLQYSRLSHKNTVCFFPSKTAYTAYFQLGRNSFHRSKPCVIINHSYARVLYSGEQIYFRLEMQFNFARNVNLCSFRGFVSPQRLNSTCQSQKQIQGLGWSQIGILLVVFYITGKQISVAILRVLIQKDREVGGVFRGIRSNPYSQVRSCVYKYGQNHIVLFIQEYSDLDNVICRRTVVGHRCSYLYASIEYCMLTF